MHLPGIIVAGNGGTAIEGIVWSLKGLYKIAAVMFSGVHKANDFAIRIGVLIFRISGFGFRGILCRPVKKPVHSPIGVFAV